MQKILANITVRQRIIILAVAILVGGGLFSLVQWKKEAGFKPLFTKLAPEDAAAIVQKLKENGAEYRLNEGGGSVLVPEARVDELRLALAAVGFPKSGRIGFELFDKVNLGATEFTEHVNYRRALEGELERTVLSLDEVEQARVHITFPKESVFLESQQPAKASVLVRLKPGKRLAPQNVVAIDHLVASAVEGLSPDAVSVLDMNGNLLGKPKAAPALDGSEPSGAALDYRRQIEADLMAKIGATLAPLLGSERFRAGVSVECDFTGGELSEEIFDPARSVMVSSQRTEDGTGASTAGGQPGTASALPRPAPRTAAGSARVTRSTENITYQSTRTVKKTHLPAGSLRKMSVAVLLDQDVTWEKDGPGFKRVLVPPTTEKLKAIRGLVAGIVGFTEERGDQLVIETLPFETTLLTEPPRVSGPATSGKPVAAPWGLPLNLDRKQLLIGAGALGGVLVLAILGLVLRRGKSRKVAAPQSSAPAEIAAPATPAMAPALTAAAAPASNLESRIESELAERDALQQRMEDQALASLKGTPITTKKAEVLAKHLRDKIAKEPDISVQILRSWMREAEN
jgi:flagellar M-ring protein FliF